MNIIPLEKIFHYQGRELRTIAQSDEIRIIAKDVCEILELGNVSKAVEKLDEDEKGITSSDTLGGNQQMLYVTEPGFYKLVFQSRKSEAKEFTRWVTHDVLPSIRKTDKYEIPPLAKSITQIPASMNRYLNMAEQQKLDALTKLMEDARNLEYSVQDDELHLQMKLICFHAFGILNNWNAPLEENDKLLLELLQMRLDIQEQHTKSFNHASVEQRIQDFVQTHMKPVVFRLR